MADLLTLPARATWEQYAAVVHHAARVFRRRAMIVGELAAKGEDLFGEQVWQVIDSFGYTHGAIENFKYVWRRVKDDYTDALGFAFWQDCASIEQPERRHDFVTRCLAENWTRKDWRGYLPEFRVADLHASVTPSESSAVTTMNGNGQGPQNASEAPARPNPALAASLKSVADKVPGFVNALTRLAREPESAAGRTQTLLAGDDLMSAWVELGEELKK